MRGTLEERFWEKVAFLGAGLDDCWEWRGGKSKGYGEINRGGRGSEHLSAHRVSWELANDLIPKGMCVLHHCDNPSCVNPAHLFLDTQVENLQDMMRKGRSARGERVAGAKLTEQDVHEIRQMLSRGISQRVVARKYGVIQQTVAAINVGQSWGWLKSSVKPVGQLALGV